MKTVMGQSQLTLIANHLITKGSISPVEASAIYKVRSLSRRINDLEDNGFGIRRVRDVDQCGQRYVRYVFVSLPGVKQAAA